MFSDQCRTCRLSVCLLRFSIVFLINWMCVLLLVQFVAFVHSFMQLLTPTIVFNSISLHFPIAMVSFKAISRLIQSSNVISLTLSGDRANQECMEFFLKNFNISEFTRLRLLTLSKVNKIVMHQILQHVTTDSLVSLTVDISGLPNETIFSIIFSVVVQTNLRKLYLNNLDYTTNAISWPDQNTLEQLTIRDCTYQGYCTILCHSHRLRTLVIRKYIKSIADVTLNSYTVAASNSAKRQRTSIDSTGTES